MNLKMRIIRYRNSRVFISPRWPPAFGKKIDLIQEFLFDQFHSLVKPGCYILFSFCFIPSGVEMTNPTAQVSCNLVSGWAIMGVDSIINGILNLK